MAILTALMLLLASGQEPNPQEATFTDPALGLSFVHPSTWVTIATPTPAPKAGNRLKLPFGKKRDPKKPPEGTVSFSIPGADGSGPAELTIVRASFSDAPEKWQQIQADANRNLKRDVERQWQQEILGVPLLLTRIAFVQDGAAKSAITGLLYNAAPYKLLFRLTGPTASFDSAQYEFTKAMETLRTTNDTLPTAQEPGKVIPPPPPPPGPDAKHPLFAKQKIDPKAAPLSLAVAVGDRKMLLRVPEGWRLEKFGNDVATLRHPDVKGPVTVKLYATATAPRPTEALAAMSNATLDEFKAVAAREDTSGAPNKAGNPVVAVWRRGEGASGPHASLEAVAVTGDYYLLVSCRPQPGAASERKVVQAMLDAVGLEPAP